MENKLVELRRLVSQFAADFDEYKKSKRFNEQMTRQQYIDNFLKLLDWDISNSLGLSYSEREVVAEEFSNNKDRPDYTIRMNGMSKFYIEAKKVSVDISKETSPALQARRYGWNSNHKISVLTNFEYFSIYLTYKMPSDDDTVNTSLYKKYHFTEYVEKFDEIYQMISRESVINGYFDEWTKNIVPDDATKQSLDSIFLAQLNKWRVEIANEILEKNDVDSLDIADLNEQIQSFLNQIIFLRFAEDNRFESSELLKKEIVKHTNFIEYFKSLDRKYNAELFKNTSIISEISDEMLSSIVENLYFPQVSYDFSIIDLSILSKIYENFLQDELVYRDNKIILERTKSASIKAVASTPDEVVVAMVKQILDEKLKGCTPGQVLDLRIADLAVGSGIFLIETYNYIEKYLIQWYADKQQVFPNDYLVPFDIKKRIISQVLKGFDINNQAVQLTKFSLLLRILSKENKERIQEITPILPSLSNNIICGNSLVSESDIDYTAISNDARYDIVPLEDSHFNEKFDIIIGNPPYLTTEDILKSTDSIEIDVYKNNYQTPLKQYDEYFLFIEKSINSIKDDGSIILLVPNKFLTVGAGENLRKLLKEKRILKKIFDFGYTQLFPNATNYVLVLYMAKDSEFEYVEVNSANEVYQNKNGITYNTDELKDSHWFLTSDSKLREQYEFAMLNFPSIDTELIPQNGLQTSKNDVYLIKDKEIIDDDDSFLTFKKKDVVYRIEKEILKRFYLPRGRDREAGISYRKLNATNYIIFPYTGGKIIEEQQLLSKYPLCYTCFNKHKEALLPKIYGGKRDVQNVQEWYQYGRSQALKEANLPKILVGVMSKAPNFNIDRNNLAYASGGTAGYIGLFLKEGSKYTLEYMQAWLSHSFTDKIFQTIGSSFEGEFYTHGTSMYKDIPLLPVDFESELECELFEKINELVVQVEQLNLEIDIQTSEQKIGILAKKKSAIIGEINTQIDKLLQINMEK